MSRQFLGTQIDAVYHTSIVLDGIEYYFGQGVQTCRAGATHHGRPMEVIKLGSTQLPIEVVLEYLESLKEVYTAEVWQAGKALYLMETDRSDSPMTCSCTTAITSLMTLPCSWSAKEFQTTSPRYLRRY